MRWACLLLLLTACEDTRRAAPRDRRVEDGAEMDDALVDYSRAQLAKKRAAVAALASARCAGDPPKCLPSSGLVINGVDLAPRLADRVVILDLWSTWCTACADDVRAVDLAVDKYRHEPVTILGITVESLDEDQLRAALSEHLVAHPVVRVEGALASQLGAQGYVPMSFVYDQHGTLVDTHLGPWDEHELNATIDRLLASP